MTESKQPVSDPARDLLNAIELIAAQPSKITFEKIASSCKVTPWSRDFYHSIQLLQETLSKINSELLDSSFDEQDVKQLNEDIENIRCLFQSAYLSGQWSVCSSLGGPVGPEALTFLRSSSRQLRSKSSYGNISDSDIKLINNTIEFIRKDMENVRLDKSDFAREALLRGCNEVSFILNRIDIFGFSRIESPIMELGAFLFTIAEEINRNEGSKDKIKLSMASLSKTYSRLYELSKVASLAKMGYDGASWLITHLTD